VFMRSASIHQYSHCHQGAKQINGSIFQGNQILS
jgi:hypothetical protein